MANTYAEKLKDPRWQKKRLEIFQRDNFTCQECKSNENMLVVHHKIYEGKDPWDTCNEGLVTLCNDCHQTEHKYKEENEKAFLNSFYKAGFMPDDLLDLGSYFSFFWGYSDKEGQYVLNEIGKLMRKIKNNKNG